MEANAEREIIEELHEQLAVLRDQLASARAREEFLQMLLTTERNLDRESRLLALLEADRRELQARILRRAPPMPLGPPAKRGDGIGADRQAHVIPPKGGGGFPLGDQRGATFPTHRGGGHRRPPRLTLRQGGVREPWRLATLLARQQAGGLATPARDAGLAGGALLQTRPPCGEGRTRLGPAAGGQGEDPVGPGAQAVPRHQAGFGAPGGRRQTRQDRLVDVAQDAPTGGPTGRAGWMVSGGALAPRGHGVRPLGDAGTPQALRLQAGDSVAPLTATVFEGGGRATQPGDQTPEARGHRVARPGIRHRDPHAAGGLQRRGPGGGGRVSNCLDCQGALGCFYALGTS